MTCRRRIDRHLVSSVYAETGSYMRAAESAQCSPAMARLILIERGEYAPRARRIVAHGSPTLPYIPGPPRPIFPGLIAHPDQNALSRYGRRVRLTHSQFTIIFAAVLSAPRPVSNDVLFELLYGDPADGGPLTWLNALRVQLSRSRRLTDCLGIGIRGTYQGGLIASDIPPDPSIALPLDPTEYPPGRDANRYQASAFVSVTPFVATLRHAQHHDGDQTWKLSANPQQNSPRGTQWP